MAMKFLRNAALAAGLLGLALPAAASTARLAALGGGDYLDDERAVLRWYADLVDHPNLAVFELGRFDSGGGGQPWSDEISAQGGGIHARFDEAGRWGTLAAYFHSRAVEGSAGQVGADYPGGSFSLVYARSQGRLDLGLRFRGTSYAEYGGTAGSDLSGREDYRHVMGLGARWRHDEGLSFEIAGEIRDITQRTVDENRALSYLGAGGRDSYALRARARVGLSETVTLVPLLAYARDICDVYSLQLEDVAQLDGYLLQAGFGLDLVRGDGDLVVFSAEYRDGKDNQDGIGSLYRAYDTQRREWFTILVRVGVEERLLPWLTVRASLQYRRVDDEAVLLLPGTTGPAAYDDSGRIAVTTPLGLGLTAAAGRFRLDAAYNDQAPLSQATVPDANAPREAANFVTVSLRYLF